MMIAYKGFNPNLTCTSGGHTFQYKTGIWNEEPEANCRRNGFHCAEDPLDCLNYYRNWDKSVYYVVLADGDINEDGTDTKISCTRMKLLHQLSIEEFVAHSLKYIYDHPKRKNNRRVKTDTGEATEQFVIVRGKRPVAKGKRGMVLGFAKETQDGQNIAEIGLYVVDGKEILPDTWYDICGKEAEL